MIRLTMAQALIRYLCAQRTLFEGEEVPLFAGMWAIFGHGNVAGMGEALFTARDKLPTYRAHNEQAMAHTAIAYAKACRRYRMMACTTSIGPGATNMVTAAALAHVNRLPVLLLPGDVFANRTPDPVLQQIESFSDATISATDCFRPVSRFFDRITRPEQILTALPRALAVLTDPAECGPVTLGLCQDVQSEAYEYPESFFEVRVWIPRRPRPDRVELERAANALACAQRPMVIAGGGVLYSQAEETLRGFAEAYALPVAETQAGKGCLLGDHPLNLGAIGVTGTGAANACARDADLILAIGTRLQDFTTGSRTLFPKAKLIQLNVASFDAHKQGALPLIADAKVGLEELVSKLGNFSSTTSWQDQIKRASHQWHQEALQAIALRADTSLPSDAEILGAVNDTIDPKTCIVCAAGGLPGELHKLWRVKSVGSYHLEYGYSCMGYEIAGGLGVKIAMPERPVLVMVGDGSYLMMNSEIATSVMMDKKLILLVLDNRGYGCIDRLQRSTGCPGFNNLFTDTYHLELPSIDFATHARSLGAESEHIGNLSELRSALARAEAASRTYVIVIDSDPRHATQNGGHWWDVAVPETSPIASVRKARTTYETRRKN